MSDVTNWFALKRDRPGRKGTQGSLEDLLTGHFETNPYA
jgi:hypothetical protein